MRYTLENIDETNRRELHQLLRDSDPKLSSMVRTSLTNVLSNEEQLRKLRSADKKSSACFVPKAILSDDGYVVGALQFIPCTEEVYNVLDLDELPYWDSRYAYIVDFLMFPEASNATGYMLSLYAMLEEAVRWENPVPRFLFIRCDRRNEMLRVSCEAFECTEVAHRGFALRRKTKWFMLRTNLLHYMTQVTNRWTFTRPSKKTRQILYPLIRNHHMFVSSPSLEHDITFWVSDEERDARFTLVKRSEEIIGLYAVEEAGSILKGTCFYNRADDLNVVEFRYWIVPGVKMSQMYSFFGVCFAHIYAEYGRPDYILYDTPYDECDATEVVEILDGGAEKPPGYYAFNTKFYQKLLREDSEPDEGTRAVEDNNAFKRQLTGVSRLDLL